VFDQFEEIFTLGRSDPRVKPFLIQLADLVENQIPEAVRIRLAESGGEIPFSFERSSCQVILSLREDFLPHLEDLRVAMPSLAGNRFRLLRMNGEQALAAVLLPGGGLVEQETAAEIVGFVAGAADEAHGQVPGKPRVPRAQRAAAQARASQPDARYPRRSPR
jgi:hypothetical protein